MAKRTQKEESLQFGDRREVVSALVRAESLLSRQERDAVRDTYTRLLQSAKVVGGLDERHTIKKIIPEIRQIQGLVLRVVHEESKIDLLKELEQELDRLVALLAPSDGLRYETPLIAKIWSMIILADMYARLPEEGSELAEFIISSIDGTFAMFDPASSKQIPILLGAFGGRWMHVTQRQGMSALLLEFGIDPEAMTKEGAELIVAVDWVAKSLEKVILRDLFSTQLPLRRIQIGETVVRTEQRTLSTRYPETTTLLREGDSPSWQKVVEALLIGMPNVSPGALVKRFPPFYIGTETKDRYQQKREIRWFTFLQLPSLGWEEGEKTELDSVSLLVSLKIVDKLRKSFAGIEDEDRRGRGELVLQKNRERSFERLWGQWEVRLQEENISTQLSIGGELHSLKVSPLMNVYLEQFGAPALLHKIDTGEWPTLAERILASMREIVFDLAIIKNAMEVTEDQDITILDAWSVRSDQALLLKAKNILVNSLSREDCTQLLLAASADQELLPEIVRGLSQIAEQTSLVQEFYDLASGLSLSEDLALPELSGELEELLWRALRANPEWLQLRAETIKDGQGPAALQLKQTGFNPDLD